MNGRAEYYVNDGYRNGSTCSFKGLQDDEDNVETLKSTPTHQNEKEKEASVPTARIRVDMMDSDDDDSKCFGRCSKPGFWLHRTLLEKFLFGLVLLCLIGFLTVVILLATNWTDQGRSKAKDGGKEGEFEVCTTSGCVEAASNLLRSINATQDPCDDFYNYACGLWNRENPIPDDMPGYGTFSFVRERVRQQMRVLLETDQDDHQTSKSIRMTRLSYKACMNTTARDKLNSSALRQSLEELGSWPIMQEKTWDEKKFDLTWLLATGRKQYANEVFYSIYVYADARNTSRNVLYIDQGQLALGRGSRDYYLNDTMFGHQMQAYTDFLHKIVEAMAADAGINLDMNELNKNIKNILEFEKQLANITVPEDDRRNHSRMYNKWTLKELAASTTPLNWTRYFDLIFPDEVKSYMQPDTVIIVSEPEYMHHISTVLENTDAKLLSDYVLWRFVQGWVKMLDTKFDDIRQDFLRVMTGQQQKSALWKVCAPGPVNWMPLAAGSLYVREYFNTKDKEEALNMIGHLREAFTELVQKLDWMDPTTKDTAVDKAKAMLNHIGYPDFIKDNDKLDEHYKLLDYSDADSYFEMVRKILVWTQEKELKRLLQEFDKLEFEVSPAIVNAFYSPEKNAITFPAGILQPPFFNGEYPKAVNYGAIGAVIGHEITHGFDDQGSQFDKNGNLNNWWSEAAFDGFQERTKCIIGQYSNYRIPEANLNVNGKLTQGENIADNGGVKEAFTAYRKYIDSLGKEEPRLPGLSHLSNNQIFFLSYAHFWCGHKKKEAAVQQILTDEHSPEVFRVIGVLSNLNEFSEAFKCKPNSKLNPVKTDNTKCTVW